jgi:diguanylate cyclase (GGDEF)-like protein/PAS domain S-box-containing protein
MAVVAVLVAAGLVALHRQATAQRTRSESMLRLEIDANRLNALEWRAISTGRVPASVERQVVALRTHMDAQLRRSAVDQADHLVALVAAYQSALRDEFDLLRLGLQGPARQVDRQQVDPVFDALRDTAAATAAAQADAAARTDRIAWWGSGIILGLGGLVIGGLLLQFEKGRRRVALAAERESLHRDGQQRLQALLGGASDVVLVLDRSGIIVYASSPVERMLGTPSEALNGVQISNLICGSKRDDAVSVLGRLANGPGLTATLAWRMMRADGSTLEVEASVANQLRTPLVNGFVVNLRDISARKALENELRHRAFHDPLTSLPNRALLEQRVAHALRRSERRSQRVALLFLDLDDFKHVNDSLGHDAGDELLAVVAQRLGTSLRSRDTLARLGGDEFAVLIEDAETVEAVTEVAERLLGELEQPVDLQGRNAYIHTSIGIALSEAVTPESDVHELGAHLLRNADVAMYAAKNHGKNCFAVFEPALHAAALKRLDHKAELHRALERGEFLLHYQPIVLLKDRHVEGMEALVRWNHPQRGQVAPAEFIPLAEESGLIVPLGRWVLRTACQQASRWQSEGRGAGADCYVSVNVAGRQLHQPQFPDDVRAALADSGLPPGRLMLEVTESSLIDDSEANIRRLRELHDLGIRLAIDDFGTGYSAFNYLRRFPIDVIKIDRSYIQGLVASSPSKEAALVEGIIAMASGLRVGVVAEGIEADQHLSALRALDCSLGQGYLFARPLTPESASQLLRDQRAADLKLAS